MTARLYGTKAEHLEASKQRAIEYVEAGNMIDASASFISDLGKHEELAGHPVINLIIIHQLSGNWNESTARELINGTN